MTKKLTKEEENRLFPYEAFPIRFVYPLDNNKEQVVAHFQCQDHVDKYIARHKMKETDYQIWYKDESLKPAPKSKRKRKSRPKPTAAQANHTDTAKTDTSVSRSNKRTNGRAVKTNNEKSTQSSKTNKTDLEQKSPKKRTRSTSSVRGRKSSMDSTRNTTRNRKKV